MSWGKLFSIEPTDSWGLFGPAETTRATQATEQAEEGYLGWFQGTIPNSWESPPHVKRIAEALDLVDRGEVDRLAISMPPRHGKSETVTCRYPLYYLEQAPEQNVLITGYNERFARKFNRRVRNLALERGLVADDKSAADEWATTSGGLCMARGVGSPPTGTGFKRIIVDDPIRRREDADSLVYRDKAWDWYSEDLYSRLEPGGAIIMVATRWHHDDVLARAIASEPGKWLVLNLPAISDEGAALWPERYSLADLERIRAINPRAFESLYQGNPTPREGDFFRAGQIGFVSRDIIQPSWPSVVALDLASSQTGDWTALAQGWRDPAGRVVFDVRRVRMNTHERNDWIKQECDRRRVKVLIPEDPGAGGRDAAKYLASVLSGHTISIHRVSGSKESRAEPFSAQVNAGNVMFLDSPDARAAVEELRMFPSGPNDDMTDALADAFNELVKPRFSLDLF